MDPLEYHMKVLDKVAKAAGLPKRDAAEAVADKMAERRWWNVEATITVRLKLRRYEEEYGADADGRRGEVRQCIEVERQEVEGDNEALRERIEYWLGLCPAWAWDAIARDGGV